MGAAHAQVAHDADADHHLWWIRFECGVVAGRSRCRSGRSRLGASDRSRGLRRRSGRGRASGRSRVAAVAADRGRRRGGFQHQAAHCPPCLQEDLPEPRIRDHSRHDGATVARALVMVGRVVVAQAAHVDRSRRRAWP